MGRTVDVVAQTKPNPTTYVWKRVAGITRDERGDCERFDLQVTSHPSPPPLFSTLDLVANLMFIACM